MLTGEPASTLRACPGQPDTVNLPVLPTARPTLTGTPTGLTLVAGDAERIFTQP